MVALHMLELAARLNSRNGEGKCKVGEKGTANRTEHFFAMIRGGCIRVDEGEWVCVELSVFAKRERKKELFFLERSKCVV
jgi:hypothetical protein